MEESNTPAKKENKKSSSFVWKEATTFERICFVASNIFLIASVVLLFLERTQDWAYAGFDVCIGITFITDGLMNLRRSRTLSIIIFIAGLAFIVFGILRFFGIRII